MFQGGDFMKMSQRKMKEKIESIKQLYGFEGLLHVTDFSNLQSIFKEGKLYSRNYCVDKKIGFFDSNNNEKNENEKININNYVRFYYKEKTATINKLEGIKLDPRDGNIPIPVYLVFDESIMYLDHTIFSNGNPASYHTRFGKDYKFFNNIDWDNIFYRGVANIENENDRWNFKRKQEAELLSSKPISTEYLKKILFRSNADLKRSCNLFGRSSLYDVDKNMFNNENNYIDSYKIDITNQKNTRSLNLTLKTNLPVSIQGNHYCTITDLNNKEIHNLKINYPKSMINTRFDMKIADLPTTGFKLKFWFYDVLSIEEDIR